MRYFPSGATRDDGDKIEPWGFTSPLVEKAFSEYMHHHRQQNDGVLRDSDNWKKGIDTDSYYHSMSRHILDLRLIWDGFPQEARTVDMTETLCAVIFNAQGLLHELLKTEALAAKER